MEDGIFPHLRSLGEPDQLEEERRLCYVGITRARERLFLTHAWSRMLFGNSQYNPPSRFLDEIPDELVEEVEGARRGSRRRGGVIGSGGYESSRSRPDPGRGRDRMVDQAMRPTPPEPSGADGIGIGLGDDVSHAKWGDGVVLDVAGGRATRPRPPSASRRSARSDCCCRGPRWRRSSDDRSGPTGGASPVAARPIRSRLGDLFDRTAAARGPAPLVDEADGSAPRSCRGGRPGRRAGRRDRGPGRPRGPGRGGRAQLL